MAASVVVQAEAGEEITRIDDWWREHREKAPFLFREELSTAFSLLAHSPQIGRRYRRRGIPGCRRLLLKRCHFHVYYAFDGALVTVLAVRSCHRGGGPSLVAP